MKKKRVKKQNLSFNKSYWERIFALLCFILVIFLILGFISPGFLRTHGSSTISFMQDSWDGGTSGGGDIVEVGSASSWNKFLSSEHLIPDESGKLELAEDLNFPVQDWGSTVLNVSDNNGTIVNENPAIYPDIVGGIETGKTFLVWEGHDGSNYYIKAQKFDIDGAVLWNSGGTIVSSGSAVRRLPHAVSDGNGGLLVVWEDYRNSIDSNEYDIYINKLNYLGVSYDFGETPVIYSLGYQVRPRVISDGAGGAIVSWLYMDETRFYVQRINTVACSGLCWGDDDGFGNLSGVKVINHIISGDIFQMIPDGSGGALVSWADDGSDPAHGPYAFNVYVQDINGATGIGMWGVGGRGVKLTQTLSIIITSQTLPRIVSDSSGGLIVFWKSSNKLYAQKVDSSGNVHWGNEGIEVATHDILGSAQDYNNSIKEVDVFRAIIDGAGGAVVSWGESNDLGKDIYAQRLNPDGDALWNADGLPIAVIDGDQNNFSISKDILGDFYFIWDDSRAEKKMSGEPTVFVQKILSNGTIAPKFRENGIELNFEKTTSEATPYIGFSEDEAMITYADTDNDVYVQKLQAPTEFLDGVIVSSIYDFGEPVQWEPLNIEASFTDDIANIVVETRTTDDLNNWPDYDVSETIYNINLANNSKDVPVNSPMGRYIQYRLTFNHGSTPTLNSVTIAGTIPSSTPPPAYSPEQKEAYQEEVNESPAQEIAEQVTTIPEVCSNTLAEIQATPLPDFGSIWGTTYAPTFDRIKWAYDHRANIYYEYINLLNREPCATEVNWWLQNDPDIFSIRYKILTSEEYQSKNK